MLTSLLILFSVSFCCCYLCGSILGLIEFSSVSVASLSSLRHMALDKFQARSLGPVANLGSILGCC